MGNLHKNNDGFSVVEALLLLIIVGLFAVTGYYVWHTKQTADKTLQVSNSTAPAQSVKKQAQEQQDSAATPEPTKTTTTQYINGASLDIPNSMGTILTWQRTAEISNISSSSLLQKEKDQFGDAALYCEANDYALGSIAVKDSSTPYPDETLIKKLDSGKYLFYEDTSKSSFCYKNRTALQSTINSQVQSIKDALQQAK